MSYITANDGNIPDQARDNLSKRQLYILDKWARKKYWDYDVSVRSGCLTDKGHSAFERTICNYLNRKHIAIAAFVNDKCVAKKTAHLYALSGGVGAYETDCGLRFNHLYEWGEKTLFKKLLYMTDTKGFLK